jgi:large subunit ribosomal protein L18
MAEKSSLEARQRRHERIRRHIHGTSERPRLNVFRSLEHMYAQVIDDDLGNTLVAASTVDPELRKQLDGLNKSQQAARVGQMVAQRALDKGLKKVALTAVVIPPRPRKALADGARAGWSLGGLMPGMNEFNARAGRNSKADDRATRWSGSMAAAPART